MNNENYHLRDEISSTQIKDWDRMSPKKWRYTHLDSDRQVKSKALDFGSASHCYLLEPEHYETRYAVAPIVDRRTKAGKAEYADFVADSVGKTVITADDDALIKAMISALKASKAAPLFKGGAAEQLAIWERDGIAKRCLFDYINIDQGYVVDYKTTDDASQRGFINACRKYGYHLQSAHYCEGAKNQHGGDFVLYFVMQEKEPPYSVGIYCVDAWSLESATDKAHRISHEIQKAQFDFEFKDYADDGVIAVELPEYLVK